MANVERVFNWPAGLALQRAKAQLRANGAIIARFYYPPEYCADVVRHGQSQSIAAELRAGRSVLIRGVGGAGKTTELRTLARIFSLEGAPPFLDCQTDSRMIDAVPAAKIHPDFISALKEGVEERGGRSVSSGRDGLLFTADSPVYLLIDEATQMSERYFRYLVRATQMNPLLRIAMVIHSIYNVDREHSIEEIFSGWPQHVLGPVSYEEIEQHVIVPFENMELADLMRPLGATIMRFSGGFPLVVNYICLNVLRCIDRADTPEQAAVDINRLFTGALWYDPSDVRFFTNQVNLRLKKRLTAGENEVMQALATGGSVPGGREGELQHLIKIGFVARGEGRAWDVNGEILRWSYTMGRRG